MTKKWYQYWQSWITIIFLFSPIGIFLIWILAPWGKKTKWIATSCTIIINLVFILLIGFQTAKSIEPPSFLEKAHDAEIKSDFNDLGRLLQEYYFYEKKAPQSLEDLKSYTSREIPTNPRTKLPYDYKILRNKYGCQVKARLSTGEEVNIYCIK